MKEFNDFEKSMKNAFDDYAKVKPSKMLWLRISGSLLTIFVLGNSYFKGFAITAAGIIGLALVINHNSTSIGNEIHKSELKTEISVNENTINENKNNTTNISIENNSKKGANTMQPNNNEVNRGNEISIIATNKEENISQNNIKKISKVDLSVEKPEDIQNTQSEKRILARAEVQNIQESTMLIESKTNLIANDEKEAGDNAIYTDIEESNSSNVDNKIIYMPIISNINEADNKSIIESISAKPIAYSQKALSYNYDLFVGGQISYSDIELNPNNVYDKDLYKKSFQMDYNYGANVNIYKKDWYIRIGLNYNKYTEQYNYGTTSIKVDSTSHDYYFINRSYSQTISGWNTNIGGGIDSIPIYTQTMTETVEDKSFMEYDTTNSIYTNEYMNEYSIINIPLLVGREFDFESFVFNISAGISWSHIIKNSVYALDSETGKMVYIDDDNSNMSKDIFNGVISATAGYKLGRANTVFFRPEFYYKLNTIFDKKYFDTHNMYQMRFSVGLRYTIR